MTRHAAAYLRKSKDAATKAEHLARLMAAVHADGHNGDTEVYDDWGRSGDIDKIGKRAEWRRLCDDIEADRIGVVFMNDLDRGGRSLEEWLRFTRIAQRHGVRIVAGGVDYSAPENKDRLIFEAWLAERELDAAKRRAAETIRMRRSRGDVLGLPPFGTRFVREAGTGRVVLEVDEDALRPLREAMAEAQDNVPEAVRILNRRGVPSRYGKTWSWHSLTAALRRHGLLKPATRRARRSHGSLRRPSALTRLVRCHCGQLMTPADKHKELYCWVGARKGAKSDHGRYQARQRHVWDALRRTIDEMGVRIDFDRPMGAEAAAAKRATLEDELRRLGKAFRAGAVDDAEFDQESERIRGDLDALRADTEDDDFVTNPRFGPLVDWAADSEALGAQLRSRVREVRLGPDMRPVEVVPR